MPRCTESALLQPTPGAGKEAARIGARLSDSSWSLRRRPDLDPRRGEECIGTCPSVSVAGVEHSAGRLGPVLQIEVLKAREGKPRLATQWLIREPTECLLGGRMRMRLEERIAGVSGGGCRAAPPDFLSTGIAGIGLGEGFRMARQLGSA